MLPEEAMHIDGRSIPAESTLDSDTCIVGAGPAGLTLAFSLLESGQRIMIIEAGGKDAIDSKDALGFEPSDTPLEPLPESRWRQLGGTTVVWNTRLANRSAGRYIRLNAEDFAERPWLAHSGWPFGLEALNPYYERAERLVLQGLDAASAARPLAAETLALDANVAATTLEAFGFASTFTEQLPRQLLERSNVTIVTNAMTTGITIDQTSGVANSVVVSAGESRFNVRFRQLVLAAGGIENARLLLVSGDPPGLGNQHDLVGRFYMDHPRVRIGHLLPSDPSIFDRAAGYDIRAWGGRYLGGKIALTPALRNSRGLLNGAVQLIPHPNQRNSQALDAAKATLSKLSRGRIDKDAVRRLPQALAGVGYLLGTGARLGMIQRTLVPVMGDGGWSYLRNNATRFESFEMILQIEQAPHPDNRVRLGATTDGFGLRRPRVESSWHEIEIESIGQTVAILKEELERAGIGRLEPSVKPGLPPELYQIGGAHHPMGTTRMHHDPRRGVVNADGRVHGIENVYVTGSSIFPTGGYANPTLTLLALAIRLGDHLRTRTA
jgi:choline dehydrogenase-like flavoprotein